jgi:hypothetical protein
MKKFNPNKNYVGLGWLAFIKPPEWKTFNASAYTHDKNYSKIKTKEERLQADLGFLWRNLSDCNKVIGYNKKRYLVLVAINYYILVRLFGWISILINRVWKNISSK